MPRTAMAPGTDDGIGSQSRVKTAFALARFRPNGTNDRAFGHGGRVVTRSASAQARAVALQPDGKLVVVGEFGPHGGRGFALARYLT